MRTILAALAGLTLACGTTTPGGTGGSSTGASAGHTGASGAAASSGGGGSTAGGGSGTGTGAASSTSSGGSATAGASSTGGASGGSAGTSTGGSSTGGTCPSGTPGASCTPGQSPDPCAAGGYVCTLQSDFSGKCALPGELGNCLPCVGCDTTNAPLQCVTVGASSTCVRSCSTTADCPDGFATCQQSGGQSYCLFDVCGPATANGSSYYGSCNAIGSGDGTCLPVQGSGATVGICLQDGTIALGAGCSTTRGAGGDVSQSCAAGGFCFPTQVGSTQGVCEQECASSGPSGASCGSGQFCWDPDSASFDWGLCVASCTGNPLVSNCQSGFCVNLGSQNGCLP
jgi:hypothetical protein